MAAVLIAVGSAALYVALYFATGVYFRRRFGELPAPQVWGPFGYATAIFLSVITMSGAGPLAAVTMGVVCNVFAVGRMVQVSRRSLRVRGLLARVRGGEAGKALAELDHEIEGLCGERGGEKGDYNQRCRSILAIAASVSQAGHPDRALAWTMRIEAGVVGRQTAAIHAQAEAALRIATGDREGARSAIARVSRPAMAPTEDALRAVEALLEALEGDAQVATDRATRALAERAENPARMIWQMARAHGTAKIGAAQDAHEALLAIRRDGGDELVRRVARHDGPASPLAERLLSEQGAYR